jgi:hypothetical protein
MSKRTKKLKPIVNQARQGDVFLMRCDRVPEGAKEKLRDKGRTVLAYGEVTGHAHAFKDPGVCSLRAEGVAWDILKVTAGIVGRLQHEEHGQIAVGPGVYEVRIQREYDWASEASRAVVD